MTDSDRSDRRPSEPTLAAGWIAAALLAAALLPGCLEEFDPYWRVESYRILGIKSDPITLKPGGLAQISVLDYKPEGSDVTYEWSWCPVEPSAQDRYECPLRNPDGADAGTDAAMGGPDAGGGGGIDPSVFDLGTGESVFFPYPGTRESILEFCRQIQEAVAEADEQTPTGNLPTRNCANGYEISIRVEAETDAGTTRVAKKNIILWTGADAVNTNPAHEGIEIRLSKPSDIPKVRDTLDWVPKQTRDREQQWYDVPADEPTPILAGIPYDIRATVPPENVERYRPPPPRGSDRDTGRPRMERLTFQWYLSAGTLDDAKGIHVPGETEYGPVRTTGLTVDELPDSSCSNGPSDPPADLDRGPCDVFLWSIVRDDRKGLNWSERRLHVIGEADGSGN